MDLSLGARGCLAGVPAVGGRVAKLAMQSLAASGLIHRFFHALLWVSGVSPDDILASGSSPPARRAGVQRGLLRGQHQVPYTVVSHGCSALVRRASGASAEATMR